MSTIHRALFCAGCSAVAVARPDQQCADCTSKASIVRIVPAAPIEPTADATPEPVRFPHVALTVELMALAELCRAAACDMDHLSDNETLFQPATLRRTAHGVIRGLVNALGAKVAP